MFKFLKLVQENLIIAIPAVMVIGLFYGYFFDVSNLTSFIVPLTFIMVYPMMVTLQMNSILHIEDYKLQITTQIINFLVIPFIGLGVGYIFFPGNMLMITGIVLTSLLPTSGMTISWTGFAKGNVSSAIKMTIIGLILGSLAVPFYLKFLIGKSVTIDPIKTFTQIGIIVFIPLIAGWMTHITLSHIFGKEKFHKQIKPYFPPLSTIGVLGVVFVAIALKSKTLIEHPFTIAYMILPVITLYILNFIISTVVAKLFFKRADALALVFGTVLRNLSIALALAINVFGKEGADIAIIIALAYIIQVQAASYYVKFADIIFKKEPIQEVS